MYSAACGDRVWGAPRAPGVLSQRLATVLGASPGLATEFFTTILAPVRIAIFDKKFQTLMTSAICLMAQKRIDKQTDLSRSAPPASLWSTC